MQPPSLSSTSPIPLSTLLSTKAPITIDGALATYLETLGLSITTSLWSASALLSHPSLIKRAHYDYYRAGANIAITASYQASIPGLTQHLQCTEKEAADLVKKSVQLAKDAKEEYLREITDEDERKRKEGMLLVAGSVGPYGAYLADGSEYTGSYTLSPEKYKDFHRGRIQALIQAGVDVLACETIPSFAEAKALCALLQDEFPEAEAWFTFTLRDEARISDGTALEEVVRGLEGTRQVVAVGVNCVPDGIVLGALQKLKSLTSLPLVVYPNSGEQWNAEKRDWQGSRNEGGKLAERVDEWYIAGARLIGGCCRTTPDDIRTIATALSNLTRSK